MTTTETTQSAPAAKSASRPKLPRVNWHDRYDELKAVADEHEVLCDTLTAAVAAWHDEAQHSGAFRHCDYPVCEAANDILYSASEGD